MYCGKKEGKFWNRCLLLYQLQVPDDLEMTGDLVEYKGNIGNVLYYTEFPTRDGNKVKEIVFTNKYTPAPNPPQPTPNPNPNPPQPPTAPEPSRATEPSTEPVPVPPTGGGNTPSGQGGSGSVRTGDENNILTWLIVCMAAVAVIGISGTLVLKKRRGNK